MTKKIKSYLDIRKVLKTCLVLDFLGMATMVHGAAFSPVAHVAADSLSNSASMKPKAPIDEVLVVDTTVKKKVVPQFIDFDPMKYQMQKRFLKKGKPFERKHFYDHMFFGAMVGYDALVPRGGLVKNAIPYEVFIGNQFTRLHGLRLSASYAQWNFPNSRNYMKQFGADLDYMFDLSSYISGYDPYRKLSFTAIAGVGYLHNSYLNQKDHVYKGQVGLQMGLLLGSNTRLFVEPYMSVATGNLDGSSSGVNVLDYDVLYGARGGLSFYLHDSKDYPHDKTYNGNLFFELAQGAHGFMGANMPFFRSMGTSYQISMGKWLDSVLGLRAAAAFSDFYWLSKTEPAGLATPAYETLYKGGTVEGRLEALFNLMNLAPSMRDIYRPVDLNISVGPIYGYKVNPNPDAYVGLRCNYWGVTSAMQVLYNADANTALFVEPRFTYGTYKVPYTNVAYDKIFKDKYMTFSAGIRFTRPTRSFREEFKGDVFEPYAFFGASLGGHKHFRTVNSVGDASFNALTSVHAGYHLFPYLGAKLQVEYWNYARNMVGSYKTEFMGVDKTFGAQFKHRYGLLNTKLSLMLNLTNLYQGYNQDRKLNLYGIIGPAYAVYVNHGASIYKKETVVGNNMRPMYNSRVGQGAWGVAGGFHVDCSITSRWGIYFEPELQYFLKKDFVGMGATSRLNDLFLKFGVGCSYRL